MVPQIDAEESSAHDPHRDRLHFRRDVYVGDVAYTIRGRHMHPPKHLRCFRKFARKR